jgi:glutaminase
MFFLDKPHNPLLNSGAIMSASLLLNLVHPEMKMSEKFDYVENYLQRIAGGEFFRFVTVYYRQ